MTLNATLTREELISSKTTLLDDIIFAAIDMLLQVPMDTDMPHVHLGIRALMARAIAISNALYAVVTKDDSIAELKHLVPGSSSLSATTLHLDLLAEVHAIGEAALAIIRSCKVEPCAVQTLVSCMQSRAEALYDEWLVTERQSADA